MGTLVGHVAPGLGFLLIGMWHMFSNIRLYCINPGGYSSFPWFPTAIGRHLELYLIMGGSTASVAMELFIGPQRHQPFDTDWTIPSNHLHNFEHALISFTFFTYAAFAVLFDSLKIRAGHQLTQLLAALAFAQQLLLFHLHSADHMGVEGQYHLLLQLVVLVSLATTLIGMGLPGSFMVSYVRSISIFFQGIWFVVIGFMLWTPELIPKGCRMNPEDGHLVVRCQTEAALHRAKSLVNILFGWFMVCVAIFSVAFYLLLRRRYGEGVEYVPVDGYEEADIESLQKIEQEDRFHQAFVQKEKGMVSSNIER